ncbi:predicted protein [Chaetomium globosum CBS 148.51]|uniref:Prolyl 4-hydroxylase alpha subunit Fe(2+) 2OG dioxygenase domain-containing protein n=1 Tax=Chaetomium globosum (strain ATCC 6205 / CBS 148.51 / DSM 1962 / NBRC 6347 / NRRL 1970) TaxID=306901 RepID=Q2GUH2_CHAGB|nr:uncharacterized protein CHGG_08382 [Chaetomium globosum CBS 148.51]EAQ84368.1 predicted protein [Chaetomium globosum CBS 148.51]
MNKHVSENSPRTNTSKDINKLPKPHNPPPVFPSLNENPGSTVRPIGQSPQSFVNSPTRRPTEQSPRLITSPTPTPLKRKKPDNRIVEKGADRSEMTTPTKRRRTRRTVIDSSDEESGLGEKPHQGAKTTGASKPRESTASRLVSIDSSDGKPEQGARLGSRQNSKPPKAPGNYGATSLCNIVKDLASFPTGEVAYGAELADLPMPDIEVLNTGVIRYPYDEDQLDKAKGFAKQLRDNRSGISWEKIKRTPMCELYDPTRVANLLIILNQDYSGGEIAIGSDDKEVFFDPAAAKHPQFYIASHNRAKHDALPLTRGHRIALAYDLRLPDPPDSPTPTRTNHPAKPPSVHDLVTSLTAAENNLFYNISCWAEVLDDSYVAPHDPLLFVLETTYPPHEMALPYLCAADRAKALAVQAMTCERFGDLDVKYRLHAYLVQVTAVVMFSGGGRDGVVMKVSACYLCYKGRTRRRLGLFLTGVTCTLPSEVCVRADHMQTGRGVFADRVGLAGAAFGPRNIARLYFVPRYHDNVISDRAQPY